MTFSIQFIFHFPQPLGFNSSSQRLRLHNFLEDLEVCKSKLTHFVGFYEMVDVQKKNKGSAIERGKCSGVDVMKDAS